MINSLAQKFVAVTPPAAIVDNAAFTTNTIDTLGFRFVTIIIMLGALDIALAALTVRDSVASYMWGGGVGAGGDFSVAPETLPAATDDNKLYAIHVNLNGRKRYLDLSMTGGDGTTGSYAVAVAVLSRAAEVPSDAIGRGFAQELIA